MYSFRVGRSHLPQPAVCRQGILEVKGLARVKPVFPCLFLPAPVVITPPQSVHNVTGARVHLSCEVRAVPTPVVTWRKVFISKNFSVCVCVCVWLGEGINVFKCLCIYLLCELEDCKKYVSFLCLQIYDSKLLPQSCPQRRGVAVCHSAAQKALLFI